jgi:hypothetical protein
MKSTNICKGIMAKLCMAAAVVACTVPASKPPLAESSPDALRPPAAFTDIKDRSARSAAYFTEAARVIQHPRCLNCHPAQRVPTQGDDLHAHLPMMQAGAAGHGPAAFQCNTCHQSDDFTTHLASLASIPGHPHWALAPASMAWQGKSLREICVQLKDPARNGGRSLAAIHAHMAEDSLVGWAWHPGAGRTPAPGTQHELGELLQAWIETGATCPGA